MKRLPATLAYLPSLVWAAFLLYLGSRPFYEPLPQLPLPADKLAHLGLYGTLGILAVLGWRWSGRRPIVWAPWLASVTVGVIDELHQRYVPTRSSDIKDWLTDLVAITLAFALLGAWRSRRGEE